MSKYFWFPKSPFDEILVNLPFSIDPINLKFVRFSDKGAKTFLNSVSMFLVIFEIWLDLELSLITFAKFVESKISPFNFIFSLKEIIKSLFFFPSL